MSLNPALTQQLLSAFHATYTQPDKAKRQQAIMFIKMLQTQQSFLASLFTVLSQFSTLQLTSELLKSVINWIEKFICMQYDPKCKDLIRHSRADLLKIFIKGFDELTRIPGFPHKMLILLCKPISIMVNHEFNETLKYQMIESFTKNVFTNPLLVFYEVYSILLERQNTPAMNRIVANFRNLVGEMGKSTPEHISFYFEVVFMLLKQYEPQMNRLSYEAIVENQVLMDLLLQGVMTGKADMAEIPLRVLIFLTNVKIELEIKNTFKLNSINVKLFPIIYEFLIGINDPNNQELNRHRRDNEILVVVMINYFTQLLRLGKDEQQFHTKKTEILLNIIFPLLIVPETYAQELMKQDPYKYLKIKSDICNAENVESIQCAAAQLLEVYCDKVDGILISSFNICMNIIKNAISSEQNLIDSDYVQTNFFKYISFDVRLETSLVVLCIISYLTQERSECIAELEEIFQNHLIVVWNPEKPMVSVSFLYLFCYCIDSFFNDPEKGYMRHYIFDAIMVATQLTACKPLLYQIYDFLEHVIAEGEYNMVVRDRTGKIGQFAVTNAVDYHDVDALRVLESLLIDQASNVVTNYPKEFVSWITDVCYKIRQYIDAGQYNQFVVKGLELLSTLLGNDEYDRYHDELYKSFEMYMVMFTNPEKRMLFDQVLVVVNRYIQAKQGIPESVNILIDNIVLIIEENDSNIYNIFRTMCLVIEHSKDPSQYMKIYELGLLSLKQTTTKLRSLLNPLEGTLLVHLTLFHHINSFPQQSLFELIEVTMGILHYQYIKSHLVMYAKYLLIVIQCLNARFEETTIMLKKLGGKVHENFYKMIFEAKIYYDGYDRKLLIINLVNILYNKDFDGTHATTAMRTIIDVLFNQYNAVLLNVAHEYEDSSDSEKEFLDDKKEMELTLSQNTKEIFKLYPNPYEAADEYAVFKDLIERVKAHPDSMKVLDEVVADLPVGLRKFLTEYALIIKKVEGEGKKIEKRKIFKVNRAKYNLEEKSEMK